MHEQVCCCDEAANHQLPAAAAFWIIWIVSTEECSSLTQNLMQIHCSARSVILNAMATQDTCSLNGIYHPHWLVQWSGHCSHMRIPVPLAARSHRCRANHSRYINNSWTSRHTAYIHNSEFPQSGRPRAAAPRLGDRPLLVPQRPSCSFLVSILHSPLPYSLAWLPRP